MHADTQTLPISEPIDLSRLCEEDYLMAAMLPIFAVGMAPYAGKIIDPQVWVSAGMRRIFDWWCEHGSSCGEPDMIDAAGEVAWTVAAAVYPDEETLKGAMESLFPYMIQKLESCRGHQTFGLQGVNP